jgi:hypothetical protein
MPIEKPDVVTEMPSIRVFTRPKPHEAGWYIWVSQFDFPFTAAKPHGLMLELLCTTKFAVLNGL